MAKPNSTRVITIYGLYDVTTPSRIRYIGQSVDAQRRTKAHIKSALNGVLRDCNEWISSVLNIGSTIWYTVLDVATSAVEADELERHYIAKFRANGEQLTNSTDGGAGATGLRQRPETIAKRVAKILGRPVSRETREKISAAQKGRKVAPGAAAALLAWTTTHKPWNFGKKMSPEFCAAASAGAAKRPPTTSETRAKMSASHRGRKRSAEHSANISTALKGKQHSPIHNARMGASKKGKQWSANRRANDPRTKRKLQQSEMQQKLF